MAEQQQQQQSQFYSEQQAAVAQLWEQSQEEMADPISPMSRAASLLSLQLPATMQHSSSMQLGSEFQEMSHNCLESSTNLQEQSLGVLAPAALSIKG